MSARYDVIVIGAGPAGSAAAATLAASGARTLLVDRTAFPREKVCGDGLLPDAVAALRQLGVADRLTAQGHGFDTVRFVAASGLELELPVEGLVTRRVALDEVLFEEAVRRGVDVMDRTTIGSVAVDGDGSRIEVALEREGTSARETAAVLLLATGASQTARRLVGLAQTRESTAAALRGYAALGTDRASELRIDLRGDLPGGYAWAFPVGEGLWNVGCGLSAGVSRAPSLARILDRYAEELGASPWVGKVHGAPLFTRFPRCRIARGRVAAIGEAAGLTRPFSGEGIGPALESGMMAARALVARLDASGVRAYERSLRERYASDFRAWRFGEIFLKSPRLVDVIVRRARRFPGALRRLAAVLSGTMPASRVLSPVGLVRLALGR